MEINGREVGRFVIKKTWCKVDCIEEDGPKLKVIIERVKVLDKHGEYIKFEKLEKVKEYLTEFPELQITIE